MMRALLLLRGCPGCGKTTWIAENGLKPYALSADDIRLLCQSPLLGADGSESISQTNDRTVWKLLFKILEVRMEKGEFTIIDATNSKTSEINKYKELCKTYRYRIYCADFTDIPIDEVKRRNAEREPFRRVSDSVINKMYSRFKTQKVPSGVTVIKPDELEDIWLKLRDLSAYKRIHHIGDIHGCNTVLQEYLKAQGGIRDDEFYIFLGDYIDRGIENAEVVNFLISIKDKKNVLLLEGNHERWLWLYGNDWTSRSREFELATRPALDEAKVSKKDIRVLYRKMGQCAYYKYGENIYLVTHGGLSRIPGNLTLVATDQLINGSGDYGDFEKMADTFSKVMPENVYQIHGHRNTKQVPIQANQRVFNLEGQVEFGGCLRCVQVDGDGIRGVEVPNKVFKRLQMLKPAGDGSVEEAIKALRKNPYVEEKTFGNISSFNFTREAFYEKAWDEQTTRARGLYLDTMKNKVVARAYEKFFNVNERPETRLEAFFLDRQFPVTAYVKENGFLGIVSYNEYEDELFIATKSTTGGPFARWLEEMMRNVISSENLERMKQYAKEKGVTFVFECVDMEHDPHVIEYPESRLVLLDIIFNQLEFSKYEFDHMVYVADQLGLAHKEKAYEIGCWEEFFEWYQEVLDEEYEYEGRRIEGFVIEDKNGYMTKLKLAYYSFWKSMRSVAHEAIRKGYIKKTGVLTTPKANEFYGWVRTLHDREDVDEIPKDICTLRRMFYEAADDMHQ